MFRVLDPYSFLPPHDPQARVVYQSLLAHPYPTLIHIEGLVLIFQNPRPALSRGLSLIQGVRDR